MRSGRSGLDAVAWATAPALVLTLAGVGAVNGDAIHHAGRFAAGSWRLNPNHLLMEPVAALWYDLAESMDWGTSDVDRLKLLDFWVGGLTLGLYRWLVTPMLTTRRTYRNLSTAVLGSLQAFLVYWISGEPIILQMPALVMGAGGLVWFVAKPHDRSALWAGAAFGLASLFFVSNVVVAGFIFLALLGWEARGTWRLDFRRVGAFPAGAFGVGGTGLAAGWIFAAPGRDPLSWVTSYSGQVALQEHVFGIGDLGLGNLLVAGARAAYGAGRALLDVAPTVAAYRGETPWDLFSFAPPLVVLFLGTVLVWGLHRLYRSDERGAALAVPLLGWISGVVAFGMVYNNSDSQYFIQLTVPVAVLVAALPGRVGLSATRTLVLPAVALCLVWNVLVTYQGQIRYPRADRLDRMSAAAEGGSLLVYPGSDTTARLLHLLPDSLYGQRLSLLGWAYDHSGQAGLELLADSMRAVLDHGGELRIVSVYASRTKGQPWSVLDRLGYSRARVIGITAACPQMVLDSLGVGFGTRRISGDPGCIDSPEVRSWTEE